jgi:hypothetical protein
MQSQRIKLLASMASIKSAGRTQSLASTHTPRSTLRVETPFTPRCPNFRRLLCSIESPKQESGQRSHHDVEHEQRSGRGDLAQMDRRARRKETQVK